MTQLHRPFLSLAAALAAVLLVAGCSAPQTVTEKTGEGQQVAETSGTSDAAEESTDESGGAKLEKTGFGREGEYGWVTAVVSNTSADNVGRFVTVQFNMLDAKGDIVTSQDQVEQFTSASQTLALGIQVGLTSKKRKKIAKVEATLGLGSESDLKDAPNLPVGKVKLAKGEYGGLQTSFEVKNPNARAEKSARIGIVCFNKSGRIVGGGSNYPELIPAKGRVLVEAEVLTSGKPDSCEAYATPSTL